ncbi:MAG: restriction endonuclease subunit S [Parashewanella sp.]
MKVESEKLSTADSSVSIEENVPKLRFGEFDNQWEPIPLGEVTTYLKGFAFKSEDYLSSGQADSRLIRVSDLSSASVKLDNQKVFLSSELVESSARYKLQDDDILITTVGSKPELRESAVGRAIYINKAHGYLNQNLLIMRTKVEQSPKFIFSQLNTPRYINHITNIQRGNANQSNITVVDLFEYRVSTTILPEQEKIAAFLSKVDEKIALLTEKKDKLIEYKRGVMQQLFSGQWKVDSGELTFTPPTLRFKADDGSEFPDWEEKVLGDVGSIVNGLTYSPDNVVENGTLVLRSSNIQNDQLSFRDNVYVNADKFNPVMVGDILICVRNGSKSLIGKNALITVQAEGMAFGAFMTVYRSKYSAYLQHYFKTDAYKRNVHRNLGATINSINGADLKKFKVSMPSTAEQNKIAVLLNSLDMKIQHTISALEKAKEWKRGLLQQMFV